VVTEGIVNAVAHRDYTSNASVEIMLFSDRLEIWNPGSLPPSLRIADLRKPHASQPSNPLLSEPLFLTKYIEKAGTGTIDIYDQCRAAGMRLPKFRIESGLFILTVWRKQSTLPETQSQPESPTQLPTQSPTQSSDPVYRLLLVLQKAPLSSGELRSALNIKHRPTFRDNYIHPALQLGFIEYTIPDKLNSRLQKYHITAKGRARLAVKRKGKSND
jgi:predicted HTH transcriptional regulator